MPGLYFYPEAQKQRDRETLVWLLEALPRSVADILEAGAEAIDSDTARAIVAGAKGRVGEDTGRLLHGITFGKFGGLTYAVARAISPQGAHADYALFVEKGHGSGVADSDFFAGDGGAALGRDKGEGKGAAPHPFFYPAVLGPLADREAKVEAMFGRFVNALNFQ